MDVNFILNREEGLFEEDFLSSLPDLKTLVRDAKILVIGGAGSIGRAVVLELMSLSPKAIHIVDSSENELVETVRTIRSSISNIVVSLQTFAIDYGGIEFHGLIQSQKYYDYVFNLAALKHVRSERDPYTLMRLVRVNIFNTRDSLCLLRGKGLKNYFCVSTDKAANPVNMMGASKKIMEMFLMKESYSQKITMARFANVAFSKGSLLEGFKNRLLENQPISAPNDVSRYFISSKEAGQLCLLSGLLGKNLDIFFPKLSAEFDLQKFTDIAIRFLSTNGYEAHLCSSEAEARDSAHKLISKRKWPCYFFKSETTGEKAFEEFYTGEEKLDMDKFLNVGIINNKDIVNHDCLLDFENNISSMLSKGNWTKRELVDCFNKILPGFTHVETGKNLDEKM